MKMCYMKKICSDLAFFPRFTQAVQKCSTVMSGECCFLKVLLVEQEKVAMKNWLKSLSE